MSARFGTSLQSSLQTKNLTKAISYRFGESASAAKLASNQSYNCDASRMFSYQRLEEALTKDALSDARAFRIPQLQCKRSCSGKGATQRRSANAAAGVPGGRCWSVGWHGVEDRETAYPARWGQSPLAHGCSLFLSAKQTFIGWGLRAGKARRGG
jgi:hypothetical protein